MCLYCSGLWSRDREIEREGDGWRRGEDGGGRPGLGHNQRRDAPRRTNLGPEAQTPNAPPPPAQAPRLPLPVGGSAVDLAVLPPFPRQPLRLRRLLLHPLRLPHLRRCPRHQRRHVRRHHCLCSGSRRGDPGWACGGGDLADRRRRVDVRFVMRMVGFAFWFIFHTVNNLGRVFLKCGQINEWEDAKLNDVSNSKDPWQM